MRESKKCCICGCEIKGYGCNPYPLKEEGECCETCDNAFVIPVRIALATGLEKEAKRLYKVAGLLKHFTKDEEAKEREVVEIIVYRDLQEISNMLIGMNDETYCLAIKSLVVSIMLYMINDKGWTEGKEKNAKTWLTNFNNWKKEENTKESA